MEKIYLAGLHYIGFTHKKLHNIFEKKQNYKEVFENINYDYLKKQKFLDKQIKFILERYKTVNLDNLRKKLDNRQAKILTFFDEEYPNTLKNIFNPPFILYVRGYIENSPKIAIIGSRNISSYGKKIIEDFSVNLCKYFTIVSGGAAGCDTKAHIEALKNNGKTIAVIGTGIDLDYPVENEKLFEKISHSGAVISIFPIGEVGNSYNFPVRNEIVAGLSQGILIAEAREKSGSLITAKLALDLGKDIFAVPGDIFRWGSVGTNNLIKSGEAKVVTHSNGILEEYNISNKKETKKIIKFDDEIMQKIYNSLILENININELSKKLNLDISILSHKIALMEINGYIKKTNLGNYEII